MDGALIEPDVDADSVRLAVASASGVDLGSVEITDIYPAVESQLTMTGTQEMFSDSSIAQFTDKISLPRVLRAPTVC